MDTLGYMEIKFNMEVEIMKENLVSFSDGLLLHIIWKEKMETNLSDSLSKTRRARRDVTKYLKKILPEERLILNSIMLTKLTNSIAFIVVIKEEKSLKIPGVSITFHFQMKFKRSNPDMLTDYCHLSHLVLTKLILFLDISIF